MRPNRNQTTSERRDGKRENDTSDRTFAPIKTGKQDPQAKNTWQQQVAESAQNSPRPPSLS
jgi:hypothetical protein